MLRSLVGSEMCIRDSFYIAPKTWAWREGRNKIIANRVDYLHCIFPFEAPFFKNAGINAQYVGNPLMRISEKHDPKNEKTIAVLPGSRVQELTKILPIIDQVVQACPEYTWKISKVAHIPMSTYKKYISKESLAQIELSETPSRQLLATSSIALITSGTASLEAAIIGCPQIVMYKTSSLNYWIGKRYIKTNYISLPNILLNEKVVEEWIQDDLHIQNLKQSIELLLLPENQILQQKQYNKIKSLLGSEKPSKIVAKSIIND